METGSSEITCGIAYDLAVVSALKLTLLLAVLVQYTPLRYCAMERVVLGSNCHDRGTHSAFDDPHDDEATCGFPSGAPHECACEQPKVDAQHDPQALKSPLEWAHVPVATAVPLLASFARAYPLYVPDPNPGAPTALQLPLLI